MLPSIEEFGIQPPVYIRKINSRTHWDPEGCKTIEERAKRVSDRLFRDSIYSIWLVRSNKEFYGLIASLSAKRNPRHQDIDFIWITEHELKEVDITLEPIEEGDCLYVQKLHYNTRINDAQAERLCYNMLLKDRKAQRCKKKNTISILEYQENLGCKAITNNLNQCVCETQQL